MSSSEVNQRNFLIPIEEIKRATNDFSSKNVIVDWSYKQTYHGQLFESSGERSVFIKCKKHDRNKIKGELSNQFKMASSFQHENIIDFIGYCFEGHKLFTVQDYAINGLLRDHLKDPDKKRSLTWAQRLKICITAARGLKHLHDGRAIHGTFSCSRIFLDENFESKIKTSYNSKLLLGAFNVDLTYKETEIQSEVYSYGLVLFEILSGIIRSNNGINDPQSLIYLVRRYYDDDLLHNLIDRPLEDQIDDGSFSKFTEIAYKCISFVIKDRPSMDEIIKTLEEALEIHAVASTKQSLQPLEEHRVTMEEIEKATQDVNISSIKLKRVLSVSHRKTAILLYGPAETRFRQELKILPKLHHNNIIRFIDFNDKGSHKIIVFEYAVNGALDEYLKDLTKMSRLTWEQRLNICLGAARGLKYLHLGFGEYKSVIHGYFHSGKILLDYKLEPKIHDFGRSTLIPRNGRPGTFVNAYLLPKRCYIDPVYSESNILKKEADVYSFGVVLFEILSGISAYNPANRHIYRRDAMSQGLMDLVRQHHESLTDPHIRDQIDGRSLDTFKELAYNCISYNTKDRPSMSKVVKRIEEALYIQKHGAAVTIDHKDIKLDNFKIPLDEINLAIGSKDHNCVGTGGFGVVYRGTLSERWQNRKVAIKFLKPKVNIDQEQIDINFRSELEMIFNFSHQNIISFIGYCDEGNEKIIVYDLAVNGGLDDYLVKMDNRRNLTWAQRLKICLGAARGLDYLHSGLGEEKRVIHRDVKSGNILLDENLEAKICDFGLSKSDSTIGQPYTHKYTHAAGTNFYIDPVYHEGGVLRIESDVYSFGVVMFELLSGMLVYDYRSFEDGEPAKPLLYQVRHYFDQRPKALIDPFIKEKVNTRSFDTFKNIAIQCISFNSKERPTMELIVDQLEEALDLQVNGI